MSESLLWFDDGDELPYIVMAVEAKWTEFRVYDDWLYDFIIIIENVASSATETLEDSVSITIE